MIQVREVMDKGITGNFEVTIVERDGLVVHSKRHGGGGKGNTTRERQVIVERIRAALEGV